MSTHPRSLVLTLLVALVVAASPAIAQTQQALVIVATHLDADYDDLLDDVQHAGSSGHTALISRYDNLEVARADLHEDRQGLEPCTCTQLDPLIAGIDATSGEIALVIDDWEAAPPPEPQPLDRSARCQAEPQP